MEGLEDAVYSSGAPNSRQDMFTTTTQKISEYVALEYTNTGEFRQALQQLAFPDDPEPDELPENTTFAHQQRYKLDLERWSRRHERIESNKEQVFALILGQCDKSV